MNDLKTIAIDLAKDVFQVCIVSPDKMKVISNQQVSRQRLPELIAKQEPSYVTLEACYSSHYWARTFEAMGHHVRLIPAQHVKPFVRGNKNDHNDALAIAEASHRPHLKFVPIKSIEQQDLQSLHRIRDRLVARRTGLVNQTRGLLSEYGIIFPKGVAGFRSQLRAILDPESSVLSPILVDEFERILCEYIHLNEHIDSIECKLSSMAHHHPLCKRLMTLPGVGIINSTALYSAIGNAGQFANPKEFAVWLGLTPRLYSSGNQSKMGGITKRGNRYLRKQLIHGARAALYRCRSKTDKLSMWATALADRRGNAIAAVALAHRIAKLAWILLQRGESYQIR